MILEELPKSLCQLFRCCGFRMPIGDRLHPLLFLRLALYGRLGEPEGDQSKIRQFAVLRRLPRWFGPPGLQVFLNATPLTGIALLLQLAPELRRVVTTFRPPLCQIVSERIEPRPTLSRCALGECAGPRQPHDGSPAQTEVSRDSTFGEAALVCRYDGIVSRLSPFPSLLTLLLVRVQLDWRRWGHNRRGLRSCGVGGIGTGAAGGHQRCAGRICQVDLA